MEKKETIGDRMKYLRVTNKKTIQMLAEEIDKSVGNISDYENNKHDPSAKVIVKIAKLFDVSTDWILCGENYVATNTEGYYNVKANLEEYYLLTQFRKLTLQHKRDVWAFSCYIHDFNIEVAYYKGFIIAIDPSLKETVKDKS